MVKVLLSSVATTAVASALLWIVSVGSNTMVEAMSIQSNSNNQQRPRSRVVQVQQQQQQQKSRPQSQLKSTASMKATARTTSSIQSSPPPQVSSRDNPPPPEARQFSSNTSNSSSNNNNLHHSRQYRRAVRPPFPNGPCGGTVIEIPHTETFDVDVNLGNINFFGDLVLKKRNVRVWLPPGYCDDDDDMENSNGSGNSNSAQRHPVLYVHDGQNAMTDSDSWTGKSWRLMGALTRLADSGMLFSSSSSSSSSSVVALPIVVLIPSAEGDLLMFRRRHLEYGDVNFPFAQAHVDLIAKTIKPMIDNRFRTDTCPSKNFAIGSSLGGQASLHLVLRYPNLFGGAACLSPAFGPQIINAVNNIGLTKGDELRNKKIYIDIGGDMGDVRVPPIDVFDHLSDGNYWNPGYFWLDTQLQDQVMTMKEALSNPSVGADLCFRQYPGGRHNERAWSERIHKPIMHMFS